MHYYIMHLLYKNGHCGFIRNGLKTRRECKVLFSKLEKMKSILRFNENYLFIKMKSEDLYQTSRS